MVKFKIVHNEVIVDKKITKLDQFALDVIKIILDYTDYVIISGYVSIFFGRNRATEDIDMFIEPIDFNVFQRMYEKFVNNGFEFNVPNAHDLFHNYFLDGVSVNIWRKNKPNLMMEIKFAEKFTQKLQLKEPLIAKFADHQINFAPIECQIAYKLYIAKSQKDVEDARHLEIVFDDLDKEKIKYYRCLFEKEFNEI